MADFVKKTWVCGDTITADDLNRLEGGVEEALSKDCDKGYSCTEERVTLTDESVTTEQDGLDAYGPLTYPNMIAADAITVTFEGTEYVCENNNGEYGAPFNSETDSYDWSEYPFNIASAIGPDDAPLNSIATETPGTYQVKIETVDLSVTTTPCFEKAVKSVVDDTSKFVVTFTQNGSTYTADHTYAEVLEAYNSGKVVEGKYGIRAEGETITRIYTLASIDSQAVDFTGVSDVYLDTSGAKMDVFKFRLSNSNTVEYTEATIVSSN